MAVIRVQFTALLHIGYGIKERDMHRKKVHTFIKAIYVIEL